MQTLNNIHLLGHVGAKAETIVFENNKMITKISLATNNLVGDKEVTQWHKLVFKGKAAEVVSLLDKGNRLSVVGCLVYKNWVDANGRKHNTAEIEVKDFSIITGVIASPSQPQETQQLQRIQPHGQQVQPSSQQGYSTQPQVQTQQVKPRSQQGYRYNTQPQAQTQQVQPRSQQGYSTQAQVQTQQVQPRSQQGYNTQPQVQTQQVQPRSQQGYSTQPQVQTQQVQPRSQQEYYDEGYYDEGIHNQNNEYYGDNAFLNNQPKSAPAVKQSYSAESQKIKMTYSL